MIEQGTQAWKDEKLGVITGTRAFELMSSNTTRRTLLATLIRELTTSKAKTFFKQSLQDKLDTEPEMTSYYSLMNNVQMTHQSAYIESDITPMFAVSPDGLIGDDGGFEGKRLDEENHIKLLLGMVPEKKYVMQCHWAIFVLDNCKGYKKRKWWDLFYYCETLPDEMRTHTIKIERDEKILKTMESHALDTLNRLTDFLNKYGIGGMLTA